MRIGILTGGGDVPGLNPCIKAVVNRVAHDGHEVVGLRRGWAALLHHDPDDPTSASEWFQPLTPSVVRTIDRTGGTFLHTSRTNPSRVRPGEVPAHLAGRASGEGPFDFTDHALRVVESLAHRRADPDRRRRHPLVRAADARRGRPGDRDPEDHGQRRPRDRLLHRLLDRRHAGRPVHPQPADVDGLARADRRRRAVRPLQRRDLADHRVPRGRRPRGHLRGAVRRRQARRAPRRRQARQPVELLDGDRLGGGDDRGRRHGALGRGGRVRAPQARRDRRADRRRCSRSGRARR